MSGDLDWRQVEARPSPRTMAIDPMRREWHSVVEQVYNHSHGVDIDDGLYERMRSLKNELERRIDVSYPECPECGATSEWGQEPGEALVCWVCLTSPPEDLRQEIHHQWDRLLRVRGESA